MLQKLKPNKLTFTCNCARNGNYFATNKFTKPRFGGNDINDFRLFAKKVIQIGEFLLKKDIKISKTFILLEEDFTMPNSKKKDYKFKLNFKEDLIVGFELIDWNGDYLGKYTVQKIMDGDKIHSYKIAVKNLDCSSFKTTLPVEYKKVSQGLVENDNGGFNRVYSNCLVYTDVFKVQIKHYYRHQIPFILARYNSEKLSEILYRLRKETKEGGVLC